MSEQIKPCPMCCAEMEPWGVNYRHPDNGCYFNFSLVPPDHVALWNRRAQPERKLTDEDILRIFYKEIDGEGFALYEVTPGNMIAFARAILAACKPHSAESGDQTNLIATSEKQAAQPAAATVRKAYICKSCDCVYADAPVTKCDCMPDTQEYIEGTITYAAQAQDDGEKK